MTHGNTRSAAAAAGILIVLIVAVSGCLGDATAGGGAPALNGTEWILSAYSVDGDTAAVLNGTTITLRFNTHTVSGGAGCNHYFADYAAERSAMRFSNIGSTEIYCGGPGVMEQEAQYLQLLGSVQRFTRDPDTLILSAANGTPLLTYARRLPPEPRPLQDTAWTLESFVSGDAASSVITGTEITAVFSDDGRVGGSAGCNQYSAEYTLDSTTLRIGPPIATKMHCTRPEGIMVQESRYLGALEAAAGYAVDGDRLSITDGSGAEILVYRAAE